MSTEVTKQYKTIEGLASEEVFKRKGDTHYVIAKVVEVEEPKSRIGDSTGSIRFRLNEGVKVDQGKVYDLKVRLIAVEGKLGVSIEGAEESSQTVEVSSNDFSKNLIDTITLREFIKISELDKKRVGASFIAKVEKGSEKDGLYVLYDETARIEAQVERKRKRIKGQKNIAQLTNDRSYNFRKTKLQFQKDDEDKGFKLIVVAGYRSIIEEQTAEDKQISFDESQVSKLKNLSAQIYAEDSPEFKQIVENTKMNVNAVSERQDKKSGKVRQDTPAERVTINQLEVGNHNQSFEGKVVEVEAYFIERDNKKPLNFWRGKVKDSTGEIEFFVPQRGLQVIKDEVYLFDKVMNIRHKGVHQVTIKKYGTLKPLNPNHPPAVVEQNEHTDKFKSEGRGKYKRQNRNTYTGSGENRQERGTRTGRSNRSGDNNANNRRANSENARKPGVNSGTRGRYNSNSNANTQARGSNRKNVSQSPPRSQFRRHDNTVETKIIDLKPGSVGQNIVGKVFELNVNDDRCKGRIGDETANIRFDFRMSPNKPINQGDTIFLSNIMNKVDDNGFHFITVGKFGKYFKAKKVLDSCNQGTDADHNLSSIEYIKKSVQ